MVGLEGEERFNMCKQKFKTPLGFVGDSHWSDWDNFLSFINMHWCFMILHNMSFLHHFLNVIMLQTCNIDPCANVNPFDSSKLNNVWKQKSWNIHIRCCGNKLHSNKMAYWTHKTKF
jgi:hypothetical protein